MAAFSCSETGTTGTNDVVFWYTTTSATTGGTDDGLFWVDQTGSPWYPGQPVAQPAQPALDPKELKLRRSREANKRSLVRARAALRAALEAPAQRVPRPWRAASRPLHARPVSKGRVCSGSSRYRVLVN